MRKIERGKIEVGYVLIVDTVFKIVVTIFLIIVLSSPFTSLIEGRNKQLAKNLAVKIEAEFAKLEEQANNKLNIHDKIIIKRNGLKAIITNDEILDSDKTKDTLILYID